MDRTSKYIYIFFAITTSKYVKEITLLFMDPNASEFYTFNSWKEQYLHNCDGKVFCMILFCIKSHHE